MPGFLGQGKVKIGPRVGGNPGALKWVGNAPAFNVSLGEDVTERNESFSGSRLPLRRATRAKQAGVSSQFDEWSADNLAFLLKATKTVVAAGAPVTDEAAPTGLIVADTVVLVGQNIATVSVRDSTGGTPLVLPPSQYQVNAEAGSWELLSLAGGPWVQPFRTTYTPGQRTVIAPFNAADQEYWVRFEGINTDDSTKVTVDLYRVRFSPADELPMINDEFALFELEGSVLVDTTKPAGGTLGQFGRIILL